MSSRHNSGGAATQAGIDYQNRVAAWMAVRILAEQDASPPWNLLDNVTLEFLRCETEQPVDDLLVGTSEGGARLCASKAWVEARDGGALRHSTSVTYSCYPLPPGEGALGFSSLHLKRSPD
jgi:hypothetical protein